MIESIGSLISAVKSYGVKLYAAALVASSILIFLPDSVVSRIGLIDFKTNYHKEIGVTFLVALSLIAAHTFAFLTIWPRRWIRNRRFNHKIQNTLKRLTLGEKETLRPFIFDGETTVYESIYDGVVNGLEAQKIIYRSSNLSVPGSIEMRFAFNLQPIAREILTQNPSLLA